MAINHLDVLSGELPDLFQARDLSPSWDEELIIVPVIDTKLVVGTAEADIGDRVPEDRPPYEGIGSQVLLKDFGVGGVGQ